MNKTTRVYSDEKGEVRFRYGNGFFKDRGLPELIEIVGLASPIIIAFVCLGISKLYSLLRLPRDLIGNLT